VSLKAGQFAEVRVTRASEHDLEAVLAPTPPPAARPPTLRRG
jgi:hypothetical protein